MINEVAQAARGELLLPGDDAINKAVGLVGDLAKNFARRQQASQLKQSLSSQEIQYLASKAKESDDDDIKQLAEWAGKQVTSMA